MSEHDQVQKTLRVNNFITFAILIIALMNIAITGVTVAEVHRFTFFD